jgi:hypothetical protein
MSRRALLLYATALAVTSCGQPMPESSHPISIAAPEPAEEEPAESASAPGGATEGSSSTIATTEKVHLELFIMSKCPFANKVLQALRPVVAGMGDNLDLDVRYIVGEADGGFSSLHGAQELEGDLLHLCARDVGTRQQWIDFVFCLSENWREIPEGWEGCADRAGLDTAQMSRCYEGERGQELLYVSFAKTSQKKVTGSPTIFIADEIYNGGRSETSFARAICAAFEGPEPAYCEGIPEPVRFTVIVVSDERCARRGCDAKRFISFLEKTFEGAMIDEIDYKYPEGKELYERSGERFLPIALFEAGVVEDKSGYDRLKRRLKKLEGSEDFVYPLGRDWDPTAEICDDGVDNTGNGKVDCRDSTCAGQKVCREEIPGKLQLFFMSRCPFGTKTVVAMSDVLETFGKKRKLIDFSLEFIGTASGGKLSSMHGDTEVNEDMRMICAQKHFPKKYEFMKYVTCRAEAYLASHGKEDWGAWKKCAKGKIKASVIEECADSREGRKLLEASFARTAELGVTGSPTWLLNNKYDMQGRTADEIKQAFCERNPEIRRCR